MTEIDFRIIILPALFFLVSSMPSLEVDLNARKKGGAGAAARFTIPTTTTRLTRRTTPTKIPFDEECDYLAHHCLKGYNTGRLCGRTLYYNYYNFVNYCQLDYANCMERFDVWQVVHMGDCFNTTVLTEYHIYQYDDDFFLDEYYLIEDH